MNLEDSKVLQAYVDGQLDPVSTIEFEKRPAGDEDLRSSCGRLREMSAAIRDKADYHGAPADLPAKIRASLAHERGEARPAAQASALRLRLKQWLGPMLAVAASLVLGLGIGVSQLSVSDADMLSREIVASHVRATLSERLIDVASSDQHTVKPWLSARLPYSPPVADFSSEGFVLAGARLEYIGGQPVAVLVYKRRQHTLDLFVWPGKDAATLRSEKSGFNIQRFSAGGLQFWAVSDVNAKELEDFARLVSGRTS
jgi:anti-sigma factor RsiW